MEEVETEEEEIEEEQEDIATITIKEDDLVKAQKLHDDLKKKGYGTIKKLFQLIKSILDQQRLTHLEEIQNWHKRS